MRAWLARSFLTLAMLAPAAASPNGVNPAATGHVIDVTCETAAGPQVIPNARVGVGKTLGAAVTIKRAADEPAEAVPLERLGELTLEKTKKEFAPATLKYADGGETEEVLLQIRTKKSGSVRLRAFGAEKSVPLSSCRRLLVSPRPLAPSPPARPATAD